MISKKHAGLILVLILVAILAACSNEEPTPTPTAEVSVEGQGEEQSQEEAGLTEAIRSGENPNLTAPQTNPDAFDETETELPAPCQPRADRALYVSLQDRICFTYPRDFLLMDAEAAGGLLTIRAPGDDDLAAEAAIDSTLQLRDGVDLLAAAQTFLGGYPEAAITTLPAALGREAAFIFEDVPGELPARHLIAIHNGAMYQLIFSPTSSLAPPAVTADVNSLWQAMITTFGFLTEGVLERYEACPAGNSDAIPYFNPDAAYCLLYPAGATVLAGDGGAISLQLQDDDNWILQISHQEVEGDNSLESLVEARLADTPLATLEGVAVDMGNQSGLAVRTENGEGQAFVLKGSVLYNLSLDSTESDAEASGQLLWETVLPSMTFVAEE